MKSRTISWALALGVALAFANFVAVATALDDYVAEVDPNYSYVHQDTRIGEGYTIFSVAMTSLKWRDLAEVDRVLWTHEVLISVPWIPHSGNQHTALIFVEGGDNNDGSSTEYDDLLGVLSVATGSVAAMVRQIPNQPLHFSDEARFRSEDAILAYGMDKYLLTRDPEWLAHLPMTKAVVRALDTVQDFADESDVGWPVLPRMRCFRNQG